MRIIFCFRGGLRLKKLLVVENVQITTVFVVNWQLYNVYSKKIRITYNVKEKRYERKPLSYLLKIYLTKKSLVRYIFWNTIFNLILQNPVKLS